jgi:signal transduction histidine kinase
MGAKSTSHFYAGGLSRRQFFAIVGFFWLYVTLSNVLYAYGMRTGIAQATNEPLFAPWNARVLQHVLLLPFLVVSFWASFRIEWRPLWLALPLQITLGIAFAAVAYPAMVVSQMILGGAEAHEHMMNHTAGRLAMDPQDWSFWIASFVSFIPAYGFGLALVTGLALYTRFRNTELRMTVLEREWSAARLAALRMQLSPHTLFNLLHTIRGYIEWDPQGAQSMVVQLADLLRRLLSAGERDFVRLSDELQYVKQYLELQQRRFADRLRIVLPEPQDVASVWVPSLIMQPLVENAVVHGLAGHQGAVTVRVSVESADGRLQLRVSNTMAARKTVLAEGIGIKNVRERLAVQFEGAAALSAGPRGADDAEWVSEIDMPAVLTAPESRPARSHVPNPHAAREALSAIPPREALPPGF